MGYLGVIIPHLLTIDPNFQRDIQVEGGPPGVSPTVYVSEFFLFGDLGKFGVSSPGMWAKSLKVPKMEVS